MNIFVLYVAMLQEYKNISHTQYIESLKTTNPLAYDMLIHHEYPSSIHQISLWIHEAFSSADTCYFCTKPYTTEEKMQLLSDTFGNIFDSIFFKIFP